jgi:hypothetical protein
MKNTRTKKRKRSTVAVRPMAKYKMPPYVKEASAAGRTCPTGPKIQMIDGSGIVPYQGWFGIGSLPTSFY